MSWQVFESHNQGVLTEPTISLSPGGRFTLNEAAYKRLGEPEFIELLYDAVNRRIGLRPAVARTLASYKLTRHASSPTYYVQSVAFMHYFDISLTSTRRFIAGMEGNALTIDLLGDSVSTGRATRREDAKPKAPQQSKAGTKAPLRKAG